MATAPQSADIGLFVLGIEGKKAPGAREVEANFRS